MRAGELLDYLSEVVPNETKVLQHPRAYRARGDYAQAEGEAQELLQLNASYAPGYVELGLIHEAGRAYDKAAAAFENYLRLMPNDPDRAAVEQRIKQNRKLAEKKK